MKLIALDLDGTLLNNKSLISNENIDAIRYAQNKGIEVTISTGRPHFDVCSICEKANISTHIIGNNGASIHFKDKKKLYSIGINKKDVKEILYWLTDKNFYYEVSTNKAIYTPFNGKDILKMEADKLISSNPKSINTKEIYESYEKQFIQAGFIFVDNYKDILDRNDDFYNILAFSFNDEKRKAGMNYFKDLNKFSVFSSGNHNFEIVNKHTSKGASLERLASNLNISLDETMAFGDNYNDVSMFEKVKYSIAMGNADENIKSICKLVTDTNYNNGVAKMIYEFIG
ncbi:Cof-type HAD-IIB family hydrolase [Clostridium sporogenes]|uniref:HAD family phosphatase n=1 Tax=Clostridium botulinum TaxID=1491 RepID=A0A6M0SXR1_CLOBO|nr:Cof-type HAD-IIB family hydrolase [Clostridium sporogenes]NFA60297.1 HAD family phosphatase [Clostridium botulinum]NFI72895.1 HAD family phosphatase [Clostridium sporogenes]NFL71453.1 HAD family phosphatase [Clostridium sporogenes]NFM22936.1 HAD family phosphatase [Clostridium sporogenes]NFP60308.1 HAD family phosphatase [Clostridium sporogenes]